MPSSTKTSSTRALSKEVYRWTVGAKGDGSITYRLIEAAQYTAGYRDQIIVERCERDALGGERWCEIHRWNPSLEKHGDHVLLTALADAITELAALARKPDPAPATITIYSGATRGAPVEFEDEFE